MPKAKKVKRTVTCGKCKCEGHNSRTCPTGTKTVAAPAVAVAEVVEVAEVTESVIGPVVDVTPPPPPPKPEVYDPRRREAPTADRGSKTSAAPYRCAKCNSVSILVIVQVKDHHETFKQKRDMFMGEMRCEQCMNLPNPAELILKWGASPNEKIEVDNSPDA